MRDNVSPTLELWLRLKKSREVCAMGASDTMRQLVSPRRRRRRRRQQYSAVRFFTFCLCEESSERNRKLPVSRSVGWLKSSEFGIVEPPLSEIEGPKSTARECREKRTDER